MSISFNQEEMAKKREIFLTTGEGDPQDIRSEILDSWKRSRFAKIDPNSPILPPPSSADSITKALHRKWLYRKEIMQEYLKRLDNLMQSTNSALFWVDENLTILYPFGDPELLNKLKSINLTVGTNLNETLVGTNAVAVASITKTDTFVIGSEHYCSALCNFACSAVPFFYEGYEEDEEIYGYSFVVTTITNFTPYQHDLLYFYSNLAKAQVSLAMYNTELTMQNELSKLSYDQNSKGMLLVNHRGVIIRANSWFLTNMGVTEHDIRGNFLKDLFPELVDTLECINTKKATGVNEIRFHRAREKNKSFYVECQPLKKGSRVIGLNISLYDKKSIYNVVNKVAHFSAYYSFEDLIGTSSSFNAAKDMARNAAKGKSNILITGESGTGKELFAQAIHNASSRYRGPFISLNCAAIPKELIGSELFGYVEGAFTGARKGGSPGKFELANRGTIFLDEIGEMPVAMQSILLRVLEEKQITPVGGTHSSPVDVRVITATNRNLVEAVDAKEFRLDLYYRLNVINIELPPLRERRDDIPLLVKHYIKKFNIALEKNIIDISPEAMQRMIDYDWPGNIRELRNVIERAINLNSTNRLDVEDLPQVISQSQRTPVLSVQFGSPNFKLAEEYEQKIKERNRISELMVKYGGNKARVAAELGITRATLYRRLRAMEEQE